MMDQQELYVGIDVSKDRLHVADSTSQRVKCFPYSSEGLHNLLVHLKGLNPIQVCLEATGGYERLLVQHLAQAGYRIAIVNPRQIRDYARAANKLAKTDNIDALIIASFAKVMKPEDSRLLSQEQQNMQDLQSRRRQINDMIVQEENRLNTTVHPKIRKLIQQAIKLYRKQLEEIDQELKKIINDNAELKSKATLLKSVPGIGSVTASMIVANLPELGTLNRQKLGRLIGVAPINRDSGNFRGHRMTGGGRKHIRNALFMPTLVAIKHNKTIKAFYQRLLQNGKTKLVAIVAAMRKLICILNAMIKDQKTWKENTQKA